MKVSSLLKIAIPLLLMAALSAGLIYYHERAPESSPVARGAHLAEAAACYACHSRGDLDPRVNLRPDPDGGWRLGGIGIIWEEGWLRADEVRDWVTHGVPERRRSRHETLLIQMPAYGDDGHLTPAEIEDVTAWALAEGVRRTHRIPRLTPPADLAAVAALEGDDLFLHGDSLARRYGCYQCHGELGQGGVANPASFKGYIPGFQGEDFLQLTAGGDPFEIRHWIEHGRGQSIEGGIFGGIAQHYFAQQALPMPAYGDALNEVEVATLIRFLLQLNNRGPLDAAAIEKLANVLADAEG